jgi:hypothetical protein
VEKYALVCFPLPFNMCILQYSVPILNVCVPVSFLIIVREISLLISGNRLIRRFFVEIGQASMTIMFLHMALATAFIQCLDRFAGLDITSYPTRVVLGIALPYLVHQFFKRYGVTRRLFLGEWGTRRHAAA